MYNLQSLLHSFIKHTDYLLFRQGKSSEIYGKTQKTCTGRMTRGTAVRAEWSFGPVQVLML